MAAARAKLFDMLRRDYFAHRTPDGRQPWAFMQAAGYAFQIAGENLAKGFDNEPELQRAWMKSRGHRANILNPLFTEIGVADANGIVVVMFGRPAPPNGVSVPFGRQRRRPVTPRAATISPSRAWRSAPSCAPTPASRSSRRSAAWCRC